MIALVAAASASIVAAVGEPVQIDADRAGNWARVFPADGGGWHYFFASGGEYYHFPMDAALTVDLSRATPLTGRSDLVDNGMTRCPDGTWLHIASARQNVPDDTGWAFRYTADFTRTAEKRLFHAEPTQVHRDMPVLCTEDFVGTGFFDPDNYVSFRLVELDADLEMVRVVEPEHAPICTGSSLVEVDGGFAIASFPGNEGDYLHVTEYALPDLTVVDRHLTDLSPPGEKAYWSQGYTRVGDHHVLAYMSRDESAGFNAQDGNVWLAVFNLDWRIEERVKLTDYTPPNGGMQPWVVFRDDTLLVSYTSVQHGYLVPVTIDRVAAGLDAPPDPVDTATDTDPPDTGDTGAPADTDVPDPGPAPSCGCRGSAALLLTPLALARRPWRRASTRG